jgi:hypothetical protein
MNTGNDGHVLVHNLTVIQTTKYLLLHTKHNSLAVMRRSDGVIVCMPSALSQTEQMQASSILLGVASRSNTPSILGAMSRSVASQYSHATVLMYVVMAVVVAVGAYACVAYINVCFDNLRSVEHKVNQHTDQLQDVETGFAKMINTVNVHTDQLQNIGTGFVKMNETLQITNANVAKNEEEIVILGTRLSKLEKTGKPLSIGTGAETKKPPSIGAAGNAETSSEVSVYNIPNKTCGLRTPEPGLNQTSWFNSWNMVAFFVVACMTGTFITQCLSLME